jgi:hypothetical protein
MQDPHDIARALIARHGNRAEAVAREHANELQASGNVTEYERWRSALVLVREFARTGRETDKVPADH